MARQPIQPPNQRIVNQYHDSDGNLILETEYQDQIIIAPNGTITHLKKANNVQLTTGEFFNPSYASGPKPIIIPGMCAQCQRRRKSVMTNTKYLRMCSNCGLPLCPVHRRQSSYDKKWRCKKCHIRDRLRLVVRNVFFERIEE